MKKEILNLLVFLIHANNETGSSLSSDSNARRKIARSAVLFGIGREHYNLLQYRYKRRYEKFKGKLLIDSLHNYALVYFLEIDLSFFTLVV